MKPIRKTLEKGYGSIKSGVNSAYDSFAGHKHVDSLAVGAVITVAGESYLVAVQAADPTTYLWPVAAGGGFYGASRLVGTVANKAEEYIRSYLKRDKGY